jgi:ABC-type nitrate/sulfonate/bicarbonate transport system permease component
MERRSKSPIVDRSEAEGGERSGDAQADGVATSGPLPEPANMLRAPGSTAVLADGPSSRRWGSATVARRIGTSVGRYWLLAGLVLVWQLVTSADRDLQKTLPAPTKVLSAGWELWQAGVLQQDILASLERVATALVIAVVVGLPLGAALGRSEKFAWSVSPIVEFFRPIPPIAWIPLSILWFGIGDRQNEFIILVAAVFPIIINTAAGVKGVDGQLIRAARSLGAGSFTLVRTVVFPAAVPSMFVGLRIGTGIAWMALVAGELVAATNGLGYLINQGRSVFRSDYIVVGMLAIGLIGLVLDAMLRSIERVIAPWTRED